jgi:hypothetical protein
MLMNTTLLFTRPRTPAWQSVSCSIPALYVNISVLNVIRDGAEAALASGSLFEVTIMPPDPIIIKFIEGSRRGDLAVEIVPAIIYSLLFICSSYIFVVRVYREWNIAPTRVSKLLKLCLLFVMASCITRILVYPINFKGKAPTLPAVTLDVFEGYGFGFDFSALVLIIASWILVVSFSPRIFTPDRVFRGSLISLIGFYIVLILINVLAQTVVVRAIILVLILIVMIAFATSGGIFLSQLRASAQQSAGFSRGVDRSALVSLHFRMTICLVGCSIGILSLVILVIVDASTETWAAWQIIPLLYEILRFIILSFIVAALFVSPKRTTSPSSSSAAHSRSKSRSTSQSTNSH